MASLQFKNAEAVRDAITATQKQEIAALYEKWADEIGEKANGFARRSTASAPLAERQMRELQKQLRATSQVIANEVNDKIQQNIYTVADAVVRDNVEWLSSLGFSLDGLNAAFTYVPDEIVRNLVTGQIYDSGWSLSASIWGDNEATLKDIYGIMASGMAENKSIYEIAKQLEQYVRPSAAKQWNLKSPDGRKIYPKQVDYNAQRLARTLVQHGYQQSFVATTQKNPFITDYVWRSNGSRVCPLCRDRDGQHYKKDELPLDHPQGMCTMGMTVADDLTDQLVDWFNSPDGTYPEIDAFAKNFGYDPNASIKGGQTGFGDKSWLQKNAAPPRMFKGTGMDPKSDRQAVVDRLAADGVSDDYRVAFARGQRYVEVWSNENTFSYFETNSNYRVRINLQPGFMEQSASENPYSRLFHEVGHAIDNLSVGVPYSCSSRIGFSEAMLQDFDSIVKSLHDGTLSMSELAGLYRQSGTNGVQDILGAAKYIDSKYNELGGVRYKWGHSGDYWQRVDVRLEAASELFAHLSSAQVSSEEMNAMQRFFPHATEKFGEVMAEVANKMK